MKFLTAILVVMRARRDSAFTLIELLVVIAIISILAAILFPVFAQAKAAAKKAVGLSNMKQQGLGAMMYADTNDDQLPETGYYGPCHNGTGPGTGGGYFSGLFSYPISTYPYVKNREIWADGADPQKNGFNSTLNCFQLQLNAAGIPGITPSMSPAEKAKLVPLSYAGNYFLSKAYDFPAGFNNSNTYGGRSTTSIDNIANVFFATDWGFTGWYTAPGYDNTPNGRWERSIRHQGGRNWAFADGHAKWAKDPDVKRSNGTYKSFAELLEEYADRGILTDPNAEL